MPPLAVTRPDTRECDLIVAAFDALLAQERVQILYWANEYLRVGGVLFRGAFSDLRKLHAYNPEALERVGAYLAMERDVGQLRCRLAP